VVNLVHKGQKLPVNVIYLKRQLRLLVPKNTPPLRLLNAKQLEEIDKYLNSPKRLLEKRRDLDEKRQIVLKLGEAAAEARKLSLQQARESSKRKTRKRRN
jgi:hypothetical protein